MIEFGRRFLALFDRRERWQGAVLLAALVVRAGFEVVGVASILPFMSVVADPGAVESNAALRWAFETFEFASVSSFLFALGVGLVVVLAVSNAVSALTIWGMLRFSWGMNHRLSTRLLEGYLAQPYGFFVQENTAALNTRILAEVQAVITGVVTPVLQVVARSTVVVAIGVLLAVLDPTLAGIMIGVLGGAYTLVFTLVRKRQRALGRVRVDANRDRFKVTGEAFGGIKEVKVLMREGAFVSRFKTPSWAFARTNASNTAVAQLPRFLLETLAFGGIVVIVLYLLRAGQGIARILPLLSLYVMAGYRLMPELQRLFSSVLAIRFNSASLEDLHEDLERFKGVRSEDRDAPPLDFEDAIRFEDVRFAYPASDRPALEGVSLAIPRNQTIGLVGPSGSGKTTLVDLLLGLYAADGGTIRVDGTPLDATTIPAWRRRIGYVPQHIFLGDETIAQNIAFGVPQERTDRERVERAATIAHLDDFVRTLPEGYETVVGERGVRLSGGQRQRIGIARALYHEPEVLILDEATSALDGATEDAVMRAIHDLAGKKTIVLIAHRLTTVRECDCIHLLEDGRVTDRGTFEELSDRSESFRAMAKLQS